MPKRQVDKITQRFGGGNYRFIFSIADAHPDYNRLDTVEEVTEPASSEFFMEDDEAARFGSSGQPSSDFQVSVVSNFLLRH